MATHVPSCTRFSFCSFSCLVIVDSFLHAHLVACPMQHTVEQLLHRRSPLLHAVAVHSHCLSHPSLVHLTVSVAVGNFCSVLRNRVVLDFFWGYRHPLMFWMPSFRSRSFFFCRLRSFVCAFLHILCFLSPSASPHLSISSRFCISDSRLSFCPPGGSKCSGVRGLPRFFPVGLYDTFQFPLVSCALRAPIPTVASQSFIVLLRASHWSQVDCMRVVAVLFTRLWTFSLSDMVWSAAYTSCSAVRGTRPSHAHSCCHPWYVCVAFTQLMCDQIW
jgi:hypothetical protein